MLQTKDRTGIWKVGSITAFLLTSFPSIGQVIISGEVKNAPKDAQVEVTYFNNTIEWEEVSAVKASLDDHGDFLVTFPLDKAMSGQIVIAEQYSEMFLVPGDSIHLTVDYDTFDESIHYTGRGAADNNYLALDALAGFEGQANRYSAFHDANKFKLYVDSLERLNDEFFKAHYSAAFSSDFQRYIRPTVKYRYINPRWMYKIGYDADTKKFFTKEIPADYFDFLKAIDLDDQQAYDNGTYSVALMRYLNVFNDSKVIPPDSLTDLQKSEFRIRKNYEYRKSIFNGNVLDYQLTAYLKNQIGKLTSDPEFTNELIEDYNATCKTPEYLAIIDKIHSQAKALAVGNAAPDLTLVDMDGRSVSLSSLKGKVVFIDFWATWCVPCIASMPKSHELIEHFKKRDDVVFLNVNVHDDKTRWGKFVTKEKMLGVNLFADNDQSDMLFKNFNFDGIPHFVLIDKGGNILDANADNSGDIEAKIQAAAEK